MLRSPTTRVICALGSKSAGRTLLLEIHGGPFANYGARFAAEIQLYAAAGHVVLYVNPRGSTSYGEDFGNLIHHAYPGNDYDDLMSAVDAVVETYPIDDSRLFVTGGSLVPLLQSTGMAVRYTEARDGHNWENWRDRLREGLSWLFPGPLWMVYE